MRVSALWHPGIQQGEEEEGEEGGEEGGGGGWWWQNTVIFCLIRFAMTVML